MKQLKGFPITVIFLFCLLLLSGCSADPSQPESVAPCLPGIAWGMTEDEVCAALGWDKEDLITETDINPGSTFERYMYGKEDTKFCGVPCKIAFWEKWDSGAATVYMQFSKDDVDAVLAFLEEQGFSLKENPSQPGVWNQQGDYMFQFCSEEEREEILQYQMRYWKKTMDIDRILEASPYKTAEELIVAVEKDTRKEIHDATLYSVQIRPAKEGESCILDMYGTYAAILNRIRASQE